MNDLGPTVDALVYLVPCVGAFVGLGMWVGRVSKQGDLTAKEAETNRQRLHDLSNSFMSFQREVAKEYVSIEAMGALEAKLISAIERLGDRLDRLFENRG